ncbi:MAG TPA: MATE family efflux transporter [Gemmatimonadales bacterium]
MHDLTEGSIARHLVRLAVPLAAGMVFQTLYYLVDIYFVAQLGDTAIAGVGAAGNVQFLVMALTQILGVGTMALIAHAVGRRDLPDANLIFNQSLVLAAIALVGPSWWAVAWRSGTCNGSGPIPPRSRPAPRISAGSSPAWRFSSPW